METKAPIDNPILDVNNATLVDLRAQSRANHSLYDILTEIPLTSSSLSYISEDVSGLTAPAVGGMFEMSPVYTEQFESRVANEVVTTLPMTKQSVEDGFLPVATFRCDQYNKVLSSAHLFAGFKRIGTEYAQPLEPTLHETLRKMMTLAVEAGEAYSTAGLTVVASPKVVEAMELEAYSNGMAIARTDTGLPTVYGAKVISVSGLPVEDENVVMVLGSGCFKAVFESSDSTNSHDDEFSRNVQRIASIRYVAPVGLSSLSAQYFTAVIA